MSEENIAYFAINNPFSQATTKKKYDFIFQFVYPEYNIDRQYRFNLREDENLHNLTDKIAASIGKSMKIQKEEMEKQEKGDTEENDEAPKKDEIVYLQKKELKFTQNDVELNYNINFNIFNTFNDGILFKILDKTYKVLINYPRIIKLELPKQIYINFPLYPSIFDTVLVDLKNCEFQWSKSLDKIDWTNLGDDYSYTPTQNDVNHFLKLSCLPKFGDKIGNKSETISAEKVTIFPHICPFETRHKFTETKLSGKSFRVVSYNILSDQYIKGRYPYCEDYALNIDYRKQLILKELTDYKADIICLQETDYKIYKNFLRVEMTKINYKGFYTPKSGRGEGVSLFYFGPRFSNIRQSSIILAEEIERNKSMSKLWDKVKKNPNVATRLLDQNTALQVVVLKSMNKSNQILVIGNTHLFYHPEAKHIRLLQIAICDIYIQNVIHQIQRQNPKCRVSLIFCGDFNSQPTAGVFEFFTNGQVLENNPDWCELPEETVRNIKLTQKKELVSAYGAPKFTNYTEDFKACLDYIFYEKKFIKLTQVVPLLSEEVMKKHTALPSIVVPSDHVALVADFKWT